MSKKYTVLIVEDDDKLRATIADYLSMYSYNILLASDGAMAIEPFSTIYRSIFLSADIVYHTAIPSLRISVIRPVPSIWPDTM